MSSDHLSINESWKIRCDTVGKYEELFFMESKSPACASSPCFEQESITGKFDSLEAKEMRAYSRLLDCNYVFVFTQNQVLSRLTHLSF